MNVYINNFNDDKIRIFDGKNWVIDKKNYVLTNMCNSKRDFLELKFDDMYDKLTNKETIEPILGELKNILYSNRHNVVKKPIKNTKNITIVEDPEIEQMKQL